jgi:hypothetical protein
MTSSLANFTAGAATSGTLGVLLCNQLLAGNSCMQLHYRNAVASSASLQLGKF